MREKNAFHAERVYVIFFFKYWCIEYIEKRKLRNSHKLKKNVINLGRFID